MDKNIKFDFNDILIVPATLTHINSRYDGINLPDKLPLFTAPMDTVVDLNNLDIFLDNKVNVCLPRTVKYVDFIDFINKSKNKSKYDNVFVSFGFDDLNSLYKDNFKGLHTNAHILIDVANGHMQKIIDYCVEIKRLRPDIIIMVGNIANPDTYKTYCSYGCIDYIRVGIGNGGGCLTTMNSKIGFPMASLIKEIYDIKQQLISNKIINEDKAPKIVADGGMKSYSDIVLSLALGADYVMVGSIFNKCLESCADNYLYGVKINKNLAKYFYNKKLPIKKYFRGMSTKHAQKAMGKTKLKTSEGVVRFRKVEYKLNGWIENFEHYLRNAMSYSNAKTLNDFIGNVNICHITKNAYERFNK